MPKWQRIISDRKLEINAPNLNKISHSKCISWTRLTGWQTWFIHLAMAFLPSTLSLQLSIQHRHFSPLTALSSNKKKSILFSNNRKVYGNFTAFYFVLTSFRLFFEWHRIRNWRSLSRRKGIRWLKIIHHPQMSIWADRKNSEKSIAGGIIEFFG